MINGKQKITPALLSLFINLYNLLLDRITSPFPRTVNLRSFPLYWRQSFLYNGKWLPPSAVSRIRWQPFHYLITLPPKFSSLCVVFFRSFLCGGLSISDFFLNLLQCIIQFTASFRVRRIDRRTVRRNYIIYK